MPSTEHAGSSGTGTSSEHKGRIVSSHGRHYMVELEDGSLRKCFPRGKKGGAAVGDYVAVTLQGEEGSIERILPRKNLLYRSDDMRTKQFAANVDRLLIVVASDPMFSDDLAGRALVGAWSAGIEPIIVLNKADLPTVSHARHRLEAVGQLGVPIVELSATDAAAARQKLLPLLRGQCSLLLGQSAMGKSTILNALVPDARAHTQEHSQALGAGRHTTTATRLYHLPDPWNGDLIDSPGFQSFGLHHFDAQDIENGFPEFGNSPKHCRFHNCSHRHEPGCAVLELLVEGQVTPQRYELYKRLLAEHEAKAAY